MLMCVGGMIGRIGKQTLKRGNTLGRLAILLECTTLENP